MTVYDRVMPNSAYNTLIALTIGMGIVIIFDFIIKLLRAYFVDMAGNSMEKNINNSLFKKICLAVLFFNGSCFKIVVIYFFLIHFQKNLEVLVKNLIGVKSKALTTKSFF